MTQTAATQEWWTRPRIILPAVAILVILAALLTPQADGGRLGDPRLTTHSTGSLGAKLFSNVAERLGWHVVQRETAQLPAEARGHTVHAVLAPVERVTPAEAHALLDAVRQGDALLLVLDERNALSDSLLVRHYTGGSDYVSADSITEMCRKSYDIAPLLWPDAKVHLWGLQWVQHRPAGAIVFADMPSFQGHTRFEAATGFEFGRGRIVVMSDPDLLRNDALRRCTWGLDVVAVRALEWLRVADGPPRTRLEFDEYHQGYGSRPSVMSTTGGFLIHHPAGRMILQLAAAALLLIIALAPRPLPPQHLDHFERRNPLEHVDALAFAYEKVRATRTIVTRLVRGLRWRVDRAASMRSRSDDMFLSAIAAEKPELSADVTLVKRGLVDALKDRELGQVGDALHRIESGLTTKP